MGILIKKGWIVDAASRTDKVSDLYLDDGVLVEIGEDLTTREKNDRVIDAEGLLVLPGLVDMHVHLRDPGQTRKEDIESGSRAAAKGGFTTIVAMPNTTPVIDRPDRYLYVKNKAAQVSPIHILQAGAMTAGEEGKELSDIEGMAEAGVNVLSEDGKSVMNSRLCRKAMKKAARLDMLILDHCEDIELRGDGCMNEDENALRLNLPGIPSLTEDVITARDILIARDAGARLHLCHVSTAGAVKLLRQANAEGGPAVTAEACPHHLLLTSDDIPGDDPDYKMNPPLRTKEDKEALILGLQDGTIPVISTDHAPHTREDKNGSMKNAAFGIVGLETSFPLMYTYLVETGRLTLMDLVEKMSFNPARILGLPCGTLESGHPADVVIIDPNEEYTIDRNRFATKGRNTPFDGWKVKGKVKYTICGGRVVWEEKE